MKPLVLLAALWAALLGPVAPLSAEDAKAAPEAKKEKKKDWKPERFPAVALSKRSQPRYFALELSPYDSRCAFLLFDGDVTNGYDRLYLWIPEDEKYGEPKTLRWSKEENTFMPIEYESRKDAEMTELSWKVRWQAETHGGYDRRDYLTGVVETVVKVLIPMFYFALDYKRGPVDRTQRKGGKFPVELVIPGRVYVVEEWEKLERPLLVWDHLYFNMSRQEIRDKDLGRMLFKGELRYYTNRYDNWLCTIRQLPDRMSFKLVVSPFLEKPIIERDVAMTEAFDSGVTVPIPYGWYTFQWTVEHSLLPLRSMYQDVLDVQPFAKPPTN